MTDDWTIDLNHLTATHANGMIFQFAPHPEGGMESKLVNPSAVPPDDLDGPILARMAREAGDAMKERLDKERPGWGE